MTSRIDMTSVSDGGCFLVTRTSWDQERNGQPGECVGSLVRSRTGNYAVCRPKRRGGYDCTLRAYPMARALAKLGV